MQFFRKIVTVLAVSLMAFGANAQSKYVEGKDYDKLDTPVPLHKKAQPELTEYFWYGCPHCYHLDPAIEKWRKSKPEGVDFHHVPATGGTWEFSAKAMYIADKLGIDADAFHKAYFAEIHAKKNRGVAFKDDIFAKFLEDKFKVKKSDYDKASKSLQVKSKLKSAQNRNLLTNISSVPTFVVNGKYIVSASKAGSEARMFEIINALLEQDKLQASAKKAPKADTPEAPKAEAEKATTNATTN